MQGIFQDIRYAVRVLRAHAGFTLIAIVTLALGIGATSAMFSIANTVLFEPLPYPQPERLVRIWEFDRLRDSAREGLSGPDYLDLVARQRVFDSLTAFTSDRADADAARRRARARASSPGPRMASSACSAGRPRSAARSRRRRIVPAARASRC